MKPLNTYNTTVEKSGFRRVFNVFFKKKSLMLTNLIYFKTNYSCDATPSEIILIGQIGAHKTFLNIINYNQIYFCGNKIHFVRILQNYSNDYSESSKQQHFFYY